MTLVTKGQRCAILGIIQGTGASHGVNKIVSASKSDLEWKQRLFKAKEPHEGVRDFWTLHTLLVGYERGYEDK